jgi:F-type H+-transporting ATPase subunit gamma
MLDAYTAGKLDRVFLVQRLRQHDDPEGDVRQLLPLPAIDTQDRPPRLGLHLRAGCASVLDGVLTRYIESQVYQACVENVASEHGRAHGRDEGRDRQRGQADRQLQLVYNKARQAAITQEISEIVGGAAAV